MSDTTIALGIQYYEILVMKELELKRTPFYKFRRRWKLRREISMVGNTVAELTKRPPW
jgi:hypothetical protein